MNWQIDRFQEQPQLLDPILANTVPALALKLLPSTTAQTEDNNHWAADLLYLLSKVRGHKVVSRFLPSEVTHLGVVVQLLVTDTHAGTTMPWQTRYTLLLWASVLVLAPFALESFKNNIRANLYTLAVACLASPGKDRDAGCVLLARFVTRIDTRGYLDRFVAEECLQAWEKSTVFKRMGVLRTLALAAPLLAPSTVLDTFNEFVALLVSEGEDDAEEAMPSAYAKLTCKFLGRVAVIYASNDIAADEVEAILGVLLESLGDPDTLVRLAASKGVANIFKCLPAELREEVLDTVYSFILDDAPANNDNNGTDTWPETFAYLDRFELMNVHLTHGAMLLVAELLQRKLPVNHAHVLRLVQTTIAFEQRKLTYAVGNNVRDSACYVAWAYFRSNPVLPRDTFDALLQCLANTACFDREINIRRAAAAAIQEGVGRHSTDLRKIEIVQTLDFGRLGNREASFLVVAPKLAQLGFPGLAHWVCLHGVFSWDRAVARLAGRAVRVFGEADPTVATASRKWLESKVNARNFMYLENTMYALGECYASKTENVPPSATAFVDLGCWDFKPDDRHLAESYIHFLRSYLPSITTPPKPTIDKIMDQLETVMVRKWDSLDEDLTAIAQHFTSAQLDSVPVNAWLDHVRDGKVKFVLFLCELDLSIPGLVPALENLAAFEGSRPMDVRCAALTGLGKLVQRDSQLQTQRHTELVLEGLDDYTTNERGDVGSWMRRECIAVGVDMLANGDTTFQTEFEKKLVRLCAELLDNVRHDALKALAKVSAGVLRQFFTE